MLFSPQWWHCEKSGWRILFLKVKRWKLTLRKNGRSKTQIEGQTFITRRIKLFLLLPNFLLLLIYCDRHPVWPTTSAVLSSRLPPFFRVLLLLNKFHGLFIRELFFAFVCLIFYRGKKLHTCLKQSLNTQSKWSIVTVRLKEMRIKKFYQLGVKTYSVELMTCMASIQSLCLNLGRKQCVFRSLINCNLY